MAELLNVRSIDPESKLTRKSSARPASRSASASATSQEDENMTSSARTPGVGDDSVTSSSSERGEDNVTSSSRGQLDANAMSPPTAESASHRETEELEEDTFPEDGDTIAFVTSLRLKRRKIHIYKNVIVICIAFLLTFTAFQSMQNLQSSLNRQVGLGTLSLSVLYGTMVLSCLFLAPWALGRLGCKWTITLALVPYTLFMAANFYPTWGTLLPAAALLGAGAALLWTAKCTYLTRAGEAYAVLSQETSTVVVNRFFGIFFMVFQSAQIWGSLISTFILLERPTAAETESGGTCGALYCSEEQQVNNTNLAQPDVVKVYTLSGTYTCLCLLAVITAALCLDPETNFGGPPPEGDTEGTPQGKGHDGAAHGENGTEGQRRNRRNVCCGPEGCISFLSTLRHWRHRDQLLLIPLTVYSGMEQAFFAGDFTKSYVSCGLGIWMVGMVVVCYGVTAAVSSFISGRMVKHMGRITLIVIAAIGHCASLLILFLWQPRPDGLVVFFLLASLWGMCDSIWQTLINGLYGCVFADNKEPAFANYRLWESVGFISAFAYSNFLCVYVKIYILLATLTLGMAGYFAVEMRQPKSKAR